MGIACGAPRPEVATGLHTMDCTSGTRPRPFEACRGLVPVGVLTPVHGRRERMRGMNIVERLWDLSL